MFPEHRWKTAVRGRKKQGDGVGGWEEDLDDFARQTVENTDQVWVVQFFSAGLWLRGWKGRAAAVGREPLPVKQTSGFREEPQVTTEASELALCS